MTSTGDGQPQGKHGVRQYANQPANGGRNDAILAEQRCRQQGRNKCRDQLETDSPEHPSPHADRPVSSRVDRKKFRQIVWAKEIKVKPLCIATRRPRSQTSLNRRRLTSTQSFEQRIELVQTAEGDGQMASALSIRADFDRCAQRIGECLFESLQVAIGQRSDTQAARL